MPRLFSLLLVLFSSYSFAIDCPLGQVDKGGVCTSVCKILEGDTRTYTYDAYIWGEKPTSACIGQYGSACVLDSESLAVSVDPTGRMWSSSFRFTGEKCSRGDTFSGGTPKPFPYEGDANMNGIPDAQEDFDMDGIPNGADPNPDQNDNLLTDSDGDNVPDKLQQFYDELMAAKDESQFVQFECFDDYNCSNARKLSETNRINAKNQQQLLTVIDTLVKNGLDKTDMAEALQAHTGNLQQEFVKFGTDQRRAIYDVKKQVITSNSSVQGSVNTVRSAVNSIRNAVDSTASVVTTSLKPDLEHLKREINNTSYYSMRAMQGAEDGMEYAYQAKEAAEDASQAALTTRDLLDDISRDINRNTNSVNAVKKNVNNIKNTVKSVDGAVSSNSDKLDALQSSMDALSNGNGNGDGTGQDYSGVLSGISSGLSDLTNAVTGDNQFQAPSSDFDPNGLISTDATQSLQSDIESLRQDMATQYQEFKSILSFDTESFNDGEYHEHVLDLTVNGEQHSFKTGVLTALLDNAEIIKAVILFLFVLMGIRMLGGE